jgi:hypothetical protein
LLRADWVFRAVPVDPGPHEIAFRFRPTSLLIGGGISGLAWVVAIGSILWGILVARRQVKVPVAPVQPIPKLAR